MDFRYNASGQRYPKVVKPKKPDDTLQLTGKWKITYYQHDAQGNVMAVYAIKNADNQCGCLGGIYTSNGEPGHKIKLKENGNIFFLIMN